MSMQVLLTVSKIWVVVVFEFLIWPFGKADIIHYSKTSDNTSGIEDRSLKSSMDDFYVIRDIARKIADTTELDEVYSTDVNSVDFQVVQFITENSTNLPVAQTNPEPAYSFRSAEENTLENRTWTDVMGGESTETNVAETSLSEIFEATSSTKDEYTTSSPLDWANNETRLLSDLFNTPGYFIDALPVKNNFYPIPFDVTFGILSIMDLNEKEETFTTYISFMLKWFDVLRVWEPRDYGNVMSVTVPATNIWIPQINVQNRADQLYGDMFDRTKYKVLVNHTGYVTYTTLGNVVTSCVLDATFFPYDVQACFIQILVSSIGMSQGRFHFVPVVDQKNYRTNCQWDLYDTLVKEFDYTDGSIIQANFYIRRKPTYHMITLIIPCVTITLLSGLVFLLPDECGEKISLQVTILLSFSVFQSVILENLPKSSDNIPYMNLYVLTGILLTTISLIITILIQQLQFVTSGSLPGWIRFIMFDVLDKILSVRTKEQVNDDYEKRRIKAEEQDNDEFLLGPTTSTKESWCGKALFHLGFKSSIMSSVQAVSTNAVFAGMVGESGMTVQQKREENCNATSLANARVSMISIASEDSKVNQNRILSNIIYADVDDEEFLEEFRQVGRICDRLLFLIFITMILLLTIGIFILFNENHESEKKQ